MSRTVVAGFAGLVLGCVLQWGLAPDPAPAKRVDEVAVFNDGFAEAKQDDCEQGSEAACHWVMVQNDIPLPPEGSK